MADNWLKDAKVCVFKLAEIEIGHFWKSKILKDGVLAFLNWSKLKIDISTP